MVINFSLRGNLEPTYIIMWIPISYVWLVGLRFDPNHGPLCHVDIFFILAEGKDEVRLRNLLGSPFEALMMPQIL